jgi:hypothetical protein
VACGVAGALGYREVQRQTATDRRLRALLNGWSVPALLTALSTAVADAVVAFVLYSPSTYVPLFRTVLASAVSLAALVAVPSTITFVILAVKCTGSKRSRDNPSPWWVLGLRAPPTLLLLLLDAYVLERWVYPTGFVWCLLQATVELAHYTASRQQSLAETWFRVDTKTLLHLLIEKPKFVESREDQFRRWLRRAPWHRCARNDTQLCARGSLFRDYVRRASC